MEDWSMPGLAQWKHDLNNHAAQVQSSPTERLDTTNNIIVKMVDNPNEKSKVFPNRMKASLESSSQSSERFKTLVEKLIRKREILNSNKFSKEILSDRLRSQSGLNVIVKQLLRNKLKDLQHESKTVMSPVQRLLVQNDSKENFLDQTVGRSGSFLDRLINVMKEERQNGLTEGLPRKPKFLSLGSSQASNNLLQKTHSKSNQFLENIDIETESKIEALKFFEEAGLLSKDNRIPKITEEVNEVHPLVRKVDEPSFQKSFLEEEMTAAELETEYLADEIAKLLVQLEGESTIF